MKEIDIMYPDICLQDFGRRPTTKNDIRALLQLLNEVDGNVLEVGAWYGKTTYELAIRYPGKMFFTVDWLDNDVSKREQNARAEFDDICKYAKHLNNVKYIYKPSGQIKYEHFENIQFVFIDGDHSYDGVKVDTEKALLNLRKGSIIAWHDVRNGTFGVQKYIKEEIEPYFDVFIFKGTQIAYIKL